MQYDENRVLSEVTLKVTGTLEIGQALMETRDFLSQLMPVDEILLVRIDETDLSLHLVTRVTEDGVMDEQDQLLFMLDKKGEKAEEYRRAQKDDNPAVFVRAGIANIPQDAKEKDLKKYLDELELPASSDILVLFDPKVKAGLVAVSYVRDVYTQEHTHLFNLLQEPFGIALSNALAYSKIQHTRDILVDENLMFREASIRLTGEQDIGKAFEYMLQYLKGSIPIKAIIVIATDDTLLDHRILLHVSDNGLNDETAGFIFPEYSGNFAQQREQIIKDMPETFVRAVHKQDFPNMSQQEKDTIMRRLGINEQDLLIMMAVKATMSGILFVFDHIDKEMETQCIKIMEMLKEPFLIALHNAVRFYELEWMKSHLEDDNRALLRDIQREAGDRVIGMHQGLKHVMSLAGQVAKTPSPVLLLGETGSGKEVIATAIHRMSARSAGPFISINCGAIPEPLIDSELFGHERGAFTGANEKKRGRFERANQGTLFLDEIGELPLSAQVRLLRVLQEKEFERVGGSQIIQADVRLIAATNRDLPSMVKNGSFREDLWFRLNVFPVEIPPLRERRQDIPALAYHFIETKCRQLNLPFRPALPNKSLERLIEYDWPGNVRELQNAIERALILSRGEPLRFPHLNNQRPSSPPPEETPRTDHIPRKLPTYDDTVREYLKALLKTTHGRIAGPKGAAAVAGLNPSTLRSKIKKLGISLEDD